MAQTATQTDSQVRNTTVGRWLDTGTVAAATFETGYKPRYVKVVNVDTGDTLEYYEGMADASAVKTTASTGVRTIITSLGITVSASGFTLGVDLDVVVTSEQINWVAIG